MKKKGELRSISLVVPAYKQQKTIVKDVNSLLKTLSALPYDYEVIVVVDGRLDKTSELIKKMHNKLIKIVEYEKNQGKGFAVRQGVTLAKGDLIAFIDAGMDINPSVISLMIDLMEWNKADIVVGSKLHPESKVNYPLIRRILSWGYRTFTHTLFGFTVKDTQVGLKIFKKNVAEDVFSRLVVNRFAFDVEVLALSYALGYKNIVEAPIKLNFQNNSSITSANFWKEIFYMLRDTLKVFYRVRIIQYYRKDNIIRREKKGE